MRTEYIFNFSDFTKKIEVRTTWSTTVPRNLEKTGDYDGVTRWFHPRFLFFENEKEFSYSLMSANDSKNCEVNI